MREQHFGRRAAIQFPNQKVNLNLMSLAENRHAANSLFKQRGDPALAEKEIS